MEEYKILWIDDEKANISTLRKQIESFFPECDGGGRKLVIDERETYEGDLLALVMDPGYNLIITDLNLLDDARGDDLIRKIRENEIFTDVLLYSNDVELLIRSTEGDNYLEGIYRHATLEGLGDKICRVIQQNIWRERYVFSRYYESGGK